MNKTSGDLGNFYYLESGVYIECIAEQSGGSRITISTSEASRRAMNTMGKKSARKLDECRWVINGQHDHTGLNGFFLMLYDSMTQYPII